MDQEDIYSFVDEQVGREDGEEFMSEQVGREGGLGEELMSEQVGGEGGEELMSEQGGGEGGDEFPFVDDEWEAEQSWDVESSDKQCEETSFVHVVDEERAGVSDGKDMSDKDREAIELIRRSTKQFDVEDAKKVFLARKKARAKPNSMTLKSSPKLTNMERKAKIKKWKDLMGMRTPKKGTAAYTKREKALICDVHSFCTEEGERYKRLSKQLSGAEKELLKEFPKAKFTCPIIRTSKMTGVAMRTVERFVKQAKHVELTPKQHKGRQAYKPAEWMLIDIRNIIMS